MAFPELAGGVAEGAVDHAAALDGGALGDGVGPALDVFVVLHRQELARLIDHALGQGAVPRPDGHVGDGVDVAGQKLAFRQAAVEHVQLAFHLHGEAIDGIFDLGRGIGVKMPEPAAEIGRGAHLPEQPRQALGARGRVGGQEGPELFGQMHQNRAGLEDADRRRATAIHQRGDLRVGVGGDEAAAELIAVADLDQPGVVFRPRVTRRQQLFKHHRHFHAVGRGQRIELQGVATDRQILVMRRSRDRTIDSGEPTTVFLVPGPDFRRGVFGFFRHRWAPDSGGCRAWPGRKK